MEYSCISQSSSYINAFSCFHVQLLQEEKELKDVKTAVSGLVEVFKVGRVILLKK